MDKTTNKEIEPAPASATDKKDEKTGAAAAAAAVAAAAAAAPKKKKALRLLPRNSSAVVEITTDSGNAVCLELYSENRELGRFSVRRGTETIAVGVVTELVQHE